MKTVLSRYSALWTAILCLAISLMLPSAGSAQVQWFPFSIVSTQYRDLDGDHDPFPDTGETGRIVITIRNGSGPITNVSFILESSDSDVACIPERRVVSADLAPGQEIAIGSLDPAQPGFTFRTSDSLESPSGTDPSRLDFCLRTQSGAFGLLSQPVCFSLLADLDVPPGAPQIFIAGPDGIPFTADDGTLAENFDLDRDGDGAFTVNDTFRMTDAGTGQIGHGSYARGAAGPGGLGAIPGIACGGFQTPPEGNALCVLDPDFPMDWHFHCPPGSTSCPNIETGACVGGLCSYATPLNGQKALTPPNSLHMGAHFSLLDSLTDTTHLRSLQAFVSPPLNLALVPRPGDLQLSMFHIVDLVDNHAVATGRAFVCLDCGDVQIQSDRNPDPAADDWGPWDKLAPFQNVYDHVTAAWSVVDFTYCEFAPADAGTAPPAPRGAHETMCFPQGAWSHCGAVYLASPESVYDCAGPGAVDPSGKGVWVETKFNLASFLGQRLRIRWIGSTWMFDGRNTYRDGICFPEGCDIPTDDGWWLDNIRFTGLLSSQMPAVHDIRPAPPTVCPAPCADVDSDSWTVCEGDCDDTVAATHPYALEVNDGRDNQCPGGEGFGIIDDISGRPRFPILSNPDFFVWPQQVGATAYQVARSRRPDFTADCVTVQTSVNNWTDTARPARNGVFYYLVRATAPHLGSWGQDSSGKELTGICGL